MPTPTYDLIDSQVLSTSAASVSFTSIPATYRDLVVVIDALGTDPVSGTTMRFNSDSGSNYSQVIMFGNGSTTSSSSGTGTSVNAGDTFDTERTIHRHQIMDYSATDKHKTLLGRKDAANDATAAFAVRWANTAAITQIDLAILAGSYIAGSTFYLYGIAS